MQRSGCDELTGRHLRPPASPYDQRCVIWDIVLNEQCLEASGTDAQHAESGDNKFGCLRELAV